MRGSLSGAAGEEERASILFIHLFIYFDGEKQHYIPFAYEQGGGQKQLAAEVGGGGGGGVGGWGGVSRVPQAKLGTKPGKRGGQLHY